MEDLYSIGKSSWQKGLAVINFIGKTQVFVKSAADSTKYFIHSL